MEAQQHQLFLDSTGMYFICLLSEGSTQRNPSLTKGQIHYERILLLCLIVSSGRSLINIRAHFSSYLILKGQDVLHCSLYMVYLDISALLTLLIVWKIPERAITVDLKLFGLLCISFPEKAPSHYTDWDVHTSASGSMLAMVSVDHPLSVQLYKNIK